ncbi:hypothetical protein ADL26_04585 [Thermoactinomyces vulgaris]|nr:hypothetical protein ADL26_04585 [Thermoactinomyces vulgaris]
MCRRGAWFELMIQCPLGLGASRIGARLHKMTISPSSILELGLFCAFHSYLRQKAKKTDFFEGRKWKMAN